MFGWTEIASITGFISVAGSFLAGGYQFYLGYVFEGADGFSPALLLGWLLGDVCNIIATFWTHQLIFQRVIACASMANDIALAGQHIYYQHKHTRTHSVPELPSEGRFKLATQWSALLRPYILFTLLSAARAEGSRLDDDDIDWEFLVGACMAWGAELSYASALLPQVYDNFRRKSTGSVSLIIFLVDALSSLNYIATILLTALGKHSHSKMVEFVLEELPYIFGTALCTGLDFLLLAQYWWYPKFVVEIEDTIVPVQTNASYTYGLRPSYTCDGDSHINRYTDI